MFDASLDWRAQTFISQQTSRAYVSIRTIEKRDNRGQVQRQTHASQHFARNA